MTDEERSAGPGSSRARGSVGFDKPKARSTICKLQRVRNTAVRFRRDAYLPSILAAATMAFGCTASVNRFAVVPSHVCAGTPVKLEMDVLGSPTITVDPPLEQQAGETYVPETTTRITAAVICHDEKVTGSIVRPQGEWDPRLRVTTVESGEDRDIATTHEGREGRVTPQSRRRLRWYFTAAPGPSRRPSGTGEVATAVRPRSIS
jgi:hypothetical protein